MTGFLKKPISILTIILLLTFQVVNVQAVEIPTPPPEPTPTQVEVQTSPPSAPEAPTPPPSPTNESISNPTPAPEREEESNENENTNNDQTTKELVPQINQAEQTDSGLSGPSADGNIGNTTINTGDGLTTGTLTTTANNNTALQQPVLSDEDNTGIENTGNGSGSDNSASVDEESTTDIIQDNNADIGNSVELDTNTGESSASQNVGDSSIITGNANTSGTVVTAANTNTAGLAVSEFNVIDDTQGDLILDFAAGCILGCEIFNPSSVTNTGNGSDSTNNAATDQIISNNTFQNNNAVLENNVTLTANSGYNQTDQNTGGDSSVTTGDANISANVVSFLNNNIAGNVILGVVNIFGDLIGDIILPEEALNTPSTTAGNITNGSGSTNSTLIDSEVNNTTFQTNDALIQNNLDFEANTGDNQTSKNTGGNSTIETGEANIESQTINIANSNLDGGNWWLVLVNEAGQWVGKILGAEDQSNMAGSQGTQFTVNPNGDVTVTNQGNGAGSQNTASASQTSNTDTVQNNVARIINNINLFANSGGNSASQNTGGDSSIKTGDANIVANLVNFVNNNIAGNGRLTITIVNVFGNWIGDFVSPGHQKEADKDEATANQAAASNTDSSSSTSQNQPQNQSRSLNTSQTTIQSPAAVVTPPADNQPVNQASGISYQLSQQNSGQVKVAGANFENTDNTPVQVADEKPQTNRKVIELNLAWLLLLLPAGAIMSIAKRRIN